MNQNSIKKTRNTLSRYNTKPSKGLGQNFLIDKGVLNKIIKAADIKLSDIIIEIGSGTGILTQELAKRAKEVIAIEKDPKMCGILRESLKNQNIKNVEIINVDILKLKTIPYTLNPIPYKLVANLPYYITSPIIRKFLELKNPPSLMVLMVQKEVAQRICASPPNMNLLAVSVQFYVYPHTTNSSNFGVGARPEIIGYVPKESFWPKPKVDSAILRITQIHTDKNTDSHRFFKIVKAGFSQPRKQLVNNLSKGLKLKREVVDQWLIKNKIKPTQRAETLSINDWKNLTKTLIKPLT